MGDHTETFQVDYDPSKLSFEGLLQEFWKNHNPLRDTFYKGRQYISIILYHDEKQKEVAEQKKEEWERKLSGEIQTEIVPLTTFYLAEDYHQKYYLKRFPQAISQLKSLYPTEKDLTNSTLAARLNGFVKGFGQLETLKQEIENEWNITDQERTEFLRIIGSIRW